MLRQSEKPGQQGDSSPERESGSLGSSLGLDTSQALILSFPSGCSVLCAPFWCCGFVGDGLLCPLSHRSTALLQQLSTSGFTPTSHLLPQPASA